VRYLALIVDYDGTVASEGRISARVLDGLQRLKTSGRRVILVTGRRLDGLLAVCPQIEIFDAVVAENGGLFYDPERRQETVLGHPPSKQLLNALRAKGVAPLDVGQVVIATQASQRTAIQDVLWELGLEAQVIANRGDMMILPAGINKASGLEHALRRLGLSRHEAVGVGDAENDHSFLRYCDCAVAVANAVPAIKAAVAHVTSAENGDGVVELVDELIANDLKPLEGKLSHHSIPLGSRPDGRTVQLPPYGSNMLVAGPSGSGKSTFTAAVIERLIDRDYQVCIVDPEGDYGTLGDVVVVGNQWRAPSVSEVLSLLEDPQVSLDINLLGIPLSDRPEFFAALIPNLQAMRARTGRPHWIVLDEAHHMLPDTWGHAASTLPQRLGETILVTVHPDHVEPNVLRPIDIVVAVGHSPQDTMERFARAANRPLVWPADAREADDHVVAWFLADGDAPSPVLTIPGRAERIRHLRKYAEGDLGGNSFYFRGPGDRHNLKAQNLAIFRQIAEGIDEQTWLFHLRRGDYSRWIRDAVHDGPLAAEIEQIERRSDLSPGQTRAMLTSLINTRYTLPA
jgi:hydroxymethylpyrimidine pyrophosphatase-like HAD family hydrolase